MKATHNIVAKANGKFGLQRVGGSYIAGNFDSWAEALEAMCEAANADASIGVGQ